jgi:hypothetical protein
VLAAREASAEGFFLPPAGVVPSPAAPQVPAVMRGDGTNSSEEAAHARLRQLLSSGGLVRRTVNYDDGLGQRDI